MRAIQGMRKDEVHHDFDLRTSDERSGAAEQESNEKVERKKSELREQDMQDNIISE